MYLERHAACLLYLAPLARRGTAGLGLTKVIGQVVLASPTDTRVFGGQRESVDLDRQA